MTLKIYFNLMVIFLFTMIWHAYGAAEETPQKTELREMDFAYGRRIQLGSDSPIYRFYLDEHIYRHVADNRLVDLRVFNGQKETVPIKIRRSRSSASLSYKERKLPIFPINSQQDLSSGDFILRYQSSRREASLTLKATSYEHPTEGTSGFIIDLGENETPPKRLRVEFKPANEKQYRLAVQVSSSNDLTDWKVRVPSAAVAKMRFNGHDLERNYIDLPSFSDRYLSLTWEKPFKDAFSAAIFGQYTSIYQKIPRQVKLEGKRIKSHPTQFIYDSNGVIPTTQVQLRLPETNHLTKARISVRSGKREDWRYQTTAVFYRLKVDGTELENAPVMIPVTQAPQFKIEFLAGSTFMKDPAPELILFYNPHECVFVASGDPPFMLAYGNADLLSEPQVLDDLLEAIGQKNKKTYMGFSRLEPPLPLGGDKRLTSDKKSKAYHLRVVLWTILLASVAGLALMAYQLYRQMRA